MENPHISYQYLTEDRAAERETMGVIPLYLAPSQESGSLSSQSDHQTALQCRQPLFPLCACSLLIRAENQSLMADTHF